MRSKLFSFIFFLTLSFVFVSRALAATVFTSAYDVSTSNQINTAANHEFVLVPSGAIPEGDTLAIAFDSEFDTSSITENDVDILDDGVQLTTATDCSGAEQASVSIASDTVSITICSGDGGAIASGSTVRVRIGTNATGSGTGLNRIVNPDRSVAGLNHQGTVFIGVSTITNNLAASIAYPLVLEGGESITAVTPDPGGAPNPPDPPNPPNPPDPGEYEIDLTNPVGGESFSFGDVVTITWNSLEDAFGFVNIRYQVGGDDPVVIVENALNQFSYNWTIPDITSEDVVIIVEATDLALVLASDISGPFSIQGSLDPQVSVVFPNGGEVFSQGESVEISWVSDDVDSVDIAFSSDAGATYSVIASSLTSSLYDWIVPDIVTSEGLIRVTGYYENGQVVDESDAFFTIEDAIAPMITVIAPNGGESYDVDEPFIVSWSMVDVSSNLIVELSLDGGVQWSQVASPASDATSVDISSSEASQQALVRVRTEDATTSDTSDSFFSIVSSEEQLEDPEWSVGFTSPPPGSELVTGENYTLTWNAVGPFDGFNLLRFIDAQESILATGFTGFSTDISPQVAGSVSYRIELVYEDEIKATDTIVFTVLEDDDIPQPEDPENPEDPEAPDDSLPPDDPDAPTLGEIDISFRIPQTSYFLPEFNGLVYVLPGTTLDLVVRQPGAEVVDVIIDGRQNSLQLVDGVGSLMIGVSGDEQVRAIGSLGDDFILDSLRTVAEPFGRVILDGQPVSGAIIFAYKNGTQWNAAAYNQNNPLVTGSSGTFAWYAPPGVYELYLPTEHLENIGLFTGFIQRARAEQSLTVNANRGILRADVVLPSILEPAQSGEDMALPVFQPVNAVIGDALRVIGDLQENPVAQVAADVSIPVLGAATAASAIVLVSTFQAAPLAQYIFTFPILLFYRRKRRQFGTVYHAITKVPIPLVYVRLMTSAGKLVKTVVSDTKGRFYLSAKPGVYRIDVRKPDYIFPSEFLAGKRQDGEYLDLYTGGEIVIEEDEVLSMNIPLDPLEGRHTLPKRILLKRILRAFQWVIALLGFILALYVAIIYPTTLTIAALLLQVFLLILTRILIKPHKKRSWGMVVDASSGRPLKNAIVRLFEPKFNKLIETQITDAKGRYVFLAGPNTYYLKASKDGYEEQIVDDIDFSDNSEPKPIDRQVQLQKEGVEKSE